MSNPWIPVPVGATWAALFALIVLVHGAHVVLMGGRHRQWHAGHVLMAVGMVVMFLPTGGMLVPATVGVGVFGLAAGLVVVTLAVFRWRAAPLGTLWLASVIDLVAMAYMFAMMSTRVDWLSVLAAAWFAAQALGWASGWLGGVLERGGLGESSPPTHAAPVAALEHESPSDPEPAEPARSPVSTLAPARVVTAMRQRVIDGGRRDLSVRISLTVMAIGMGYMLLAMQFGMAAMPMDNMGGMPGMSGM